MFRCTCGNVFKDKYDGQRLFQRWACECGMTWELTFRMSKKQLTLFHVIGKMRKDISKTYNPMEFVE